MSRHIVRPHWIIAAVLTAFISFTPRLEAQSHPELAGTWLIDIAKSTASGMALPLTATYTIEYSGDSIVLKRSSVGVSGPLESRVVVRSDGKPTHGRIFVWAGAPGGALEKVDLDATTVGRWAHDTLVVSVGSELHGRPMELLLRLVVGGDRKTLIEHRSNSIDGAVSGTQDLTYRKQK